MIQVGTAILKNQLSAYLKKVKKGARLLITDRGKPVAKLLPLHSEEESPEECLHTLSAEGILTLPIHRGKFAKVKPLKIPSNRASAIILEDREK